MRPTDLPVRETLMTSVCFIIVELVFLACAHFFGGPPWTVIGVIAIVVQTLGGVRLESLALAVPSLAWLALSHATGNRELFFPYAMYVASAVAVTAAGRPTWLGPVGGAGIVVTFMVIRILQQATVRVLAVEFVVAAAILSLVLSAHSWSQRHVTHVPRVALDAAIIVASSLLAYASLAL